ncbi:molybdenum cofactor biosynthesis protein B [Arhodomonas sp. SL1]|uniref:molybdenum cofactor biosynthesis protein B n=1 Tax=Arhodomonas sp. SL1 TaxID=3425691 RepID=UPI003F8831D9
MHNACSEFRALRVAVLTISDTRGIDEDRSGALLWELVATSGHEPAYREIVPDDRYRIRAVLSGWIADADVQAVLTTGGTGFTERDGTPEAVRPLLDVEVEGFGEMFRRLSADEIGTSTIQSRTLAGFANRTFIACLPGSTGACRTAWEGILATQLDVRHRPCNLAELVVFGSHAGGGA